VTPKSYRDPYRLSDLGSRIPDRNINIEIEENNGSKSQSCRFSWQLPEKGNHGDFYYSYIAISNAVYLRNTPSSNSCGVSFSRPENAERKSVAKHLILLVLAARLHLLYLTWTDLKSHPECRSPLRQLHLQQHSPSLYPSSS